jgi:peptidoglycan hydrolase CwlO-like protein
MEKKIIITIILVNIEITIIQTIIFEFVNNNTLLQHFVTENLEISPLKKNTQNGQKENVQI